MINACSVNFALCVVLSAITPLPAAQESCLLSVCSNVPAPSNVGGRAGNALAAPSLKPPPDTSSDRT